MEKEQYIAHLRTLSDDKLGEECEHKIWLSAYAANNPKSDYHWHADECYTESQERTDKGIYAAAYRRVTAANR